MKELYKIIRNFIPKEDCDLMARKLESLLLKGIYRAPDPLCPKSPAFYGIFNDELEIYRSKVEKEIEEDIWPSYTYARIYQEKEFMPPHLDRPGAEISLTITLDYEKFIWPIYIQKNNYEFEEIILDIGDALVYQGSLASHMRHPMLGQDFQHQTFFHYVRKNGEYDNNKFDEHEELLSNAEAEKWNFSNWSDHDWREDPEKLINIVKEQGD